MFKNEQVVVPVVGIFTGTFWCTSAVATVVCVLCTITLTCGLVDCWDVRVVIVLLNVREKGNKTTQGEVSTHTSAKQHIEDLLTIASTPSNTMGFTASSFPRCKKAIDFAVELSDPFGVVFVMRAQC